jgi:predicted Rossmann fold flavoprotein
MDFDSQQCGSGLGRLGRLGPRLPLRAQLFPAARLSREPRGQRRLAVGRGFRLFRQGVDLSFELFFVGQACELVHEHQGVLGRNLEFLAARLAGDFIVEAEQVVPELGELGPVVLVGPGRQPVFLGAAHPPNVVFTRSPTLGTLIPPRSGFRSVREQGTLAEGHSHMVAMNRDNEPPRVLCPAVMAATIVVGAGAAGIVAAIFASGRSPVTVIERTSDGGRKILISGGGRCNILPVALEPDRFVTHSPAHLLRGMLRAWPLVAQREFFEREVGIPLRLEQETGKLFPVSGRARDVRDGLIELARRRGVQFQWDTSLTGLAPTSSGWRVETTRGEIDTRAVVLATGGMSVPKTGSDGTGIQLAARLGLALHDTYPALTPLIAEAGAHASLSGVSLHVRLRAKWRGKLTETSGGFLFTHRGYSGPSVLDLSHIAVRSRGADDDPAQAALLRVAWSAKDAGEWQRELATSAGLLVTIVGRHLPQRLAIQLLDETRVPLDRAASELRRDERTALLEALTAYILPWTGDEGYRKAEVTGGGIALDEVNPRTLESRSHAGLFLCGEMLDAFGPIGGHNFAWAWSTGRAAGLGAAQRD